MVGDYFLLVAGGIVVAGFFVGLIVYFVTPAAALRAEADLVTDSVVAHRGVWLPAFGMGIAALLVCVAAWLFFVCRRAVEWVCVKFGWMQSRAGPLSLIDNLSHGKVGTRLDTVLKDAQRLDVCVGHTSTVGMRQMADWLDGMPASAKVRMILGMEPRGWKPPPADTDPEKVAAYFLARHVYRDEKAMPVLDRLEEHRAAGRFEIKLRLGEPQLHAKLYVWTDVAGERGALFGSSNLTLAGFRTAGELNTEIHDIEAVQQLDVWFEARWQENQTHSDHDCLANYPRALKELK